MTQPLNDELSQIANTPQLERIAHDLERTSSQLYFKFDQLIKLDAKKNYSMVDKIFKAQLMDEIGKLILKL